jgi:uncharacterized protein YndB with AHSA1/START domain
MPDILHRLTINAPRERVHEMIATKTGIERWWSARPLEGDESVGGKLLVYFGGGTDPSAVMEVIEKGPDLVAWRCVDGPDDWRETRITFQLKPATDRETTLLFSHAGWREPTEFMSMCSTHWASYLIGLKAGLEGRDYTPFPQGEVSRWG